ncbi:hypothetical protein [Rhodocytophaga rosea]|nr:hypothetical protein [Rhodocytophaga rosea]
MLTVLNPIVYQPIVTSRSPKEHFPKENLHDAWNHPIPDNT